MFAFTVTGFLTWLGTGVDDLLVILVLMSICEHRSRLAIVAGTLVGTLTMFCLSTGVAYVAGPIFGDNTNLIGAVPLFVGLMTLRNLPDEDGNKRATNGPLKMFLMSFFIYLMNMTDDVAVNSSVLLQILGKKDLIFWLGLGNFLGCGVSLAGMHLVTKVLEKHLRLVAILGAIFIMMVGFIILFGGGDVIACTAAQFAQTS